MYLKRLIHITYLFLMVSQWLQPNELVFATLAEKNFYQGVVDIVAEAPETQVYPLVSIAQCTNVQNFTLVHSLFQLAMCFLCQPIAGTVFGLSTPSGGACSEHCIPANLSKMELCLFKLQHNLKSWIGTQSTFIQSSKVKSHHLQFYLWCTVCLTFIDIKVDVFSGIRRRRRVYKVRKSLAPLIQNV